MEKVTVVQGKTQVVIDRSCLPGIKPCCMTPWACGPATWYR